MLKPRTLPLSTMQGQLQGVAKDKRELGYVYGIPWLASKNNKKGTFMISAVYASLAALLICWLSYNVIKLRRKHQVSLGDGGVKELKVARAAQTNAIEYIPISLLLLFALELNQGAFILVNLFGVTLLVGRVIHARALISGSFKRRVLGMKVTFGTLFSLSIVNMFYVFYSQLGSI